MVLHPRMAAVAEAAPQIPRNRFSDVPRQRDANPPSSPCLESTTANSFSRTIRSNLLRSSRSPSSSGMSAMSAGVSVLLNLAAICRIDRRTARVPACIGSRCTCERSRQQPRRKNVRRRCLRARAIGWDGHDSRGSNYHLKRCQGRRERASAGALHPCPRLSIDPSPRKERRPVFQTLNFSAGEF